MRKKPYYLEVYNHILRRLYDGEIRKGDVLDSFDQLCEHYAASPNTIRSAIHLLKEDGYIKTGRGKPTIIISATGNHKKIIRKLCNHAEEIDGTFDLLRILLPQMVAYNAQKFKKADCDELLNLIKSMEDRCNEIEEFRRLRSEILHKLISKVDNLLLQKIISSAEELVMIPFMTFDGIEEANKPSLAVRKRFPVQMRRVVDAIEMEDFEQAKQEIYDFYSWNKSIIVSQIRNLAKKNGFEIGHTINSNHKLSYLYDYIVSALIDAFYRAEYEVGDYLPAESATCQKYQVSMPTVKKAYKILNELGIAKTINGKGTQVILFTQTQAVTVDIIAKLSDFREAMQILAITSGEISSFAAERIKPEISRLRNELTELWNNHPHKIHPVPILLFEIIKSIRCQPLVLLYWAIEQKLIWSVYLDRYHNDVEEELENQYRQCLEALTELEQGHSQRFASILTKIVENYDERYEKVFQLLVCSLNTP